MKKVNLVKLEEKINNELILNEELHKVDLNNKEVEPAIYNTFLIDSRFYRIHILDNKAIVTLYNADEEQVGYYEIFDTFIEGDDEEMNETSLVPMNTQLLANKEGNKITLKNYMEVIDFNDIQPIDKDAVRDITLCMENEKSTVDTINLINKNLGLKLKKNQLEENKAIKAYYNVVDQFLNKNIYGYTKNIVSVHDRFLIANELFSNNQNTIEEYSKYMNVTEIRTAWKQYKKHLFDVAPDIKKDKIAVTQEKLMWLDDLNRRGFISDELYHNISLDN